VISKIAGEDVVLHGILDAILLRIEIGNSGAGGGLVRLIKPFQVDGAPGTIPSGQSLKAPLKK